MQKKHGYYTFTIIKPWLILLREMLEGTPTMLMKINHGFKCVVNMFF